MTRIATLISLIGLVLTTLAGAAFGAEPYPPPPPKVTVTTPGATVVITGDNFGPGTTVEVSARDGGEGASTFTTQATVADDGTFAVPLTVPEDSAGENFVVEIAGTDATGATRTSTQVYAVSPSANSRADLTAESEAGGITPLHLLGAVVLLVGAGALLLRRRTRALD